MDILEQIEYDIDETLSAQVVGIPREELRALVDTARKAAHYLVRKGVINKETGYPVVRNHTGLERLGDLRQLVQNLERSLEETLNDKKIDRMLSISPTSRCENECLHCQENSTPKGKDLPYSVLKSADPSFFKIFKKVHFGHEGDSLIYSSEGRDLSDVISLLHDRGIQEFILDTKTLRPENIEVYKSIKSFIESNSSRFTQRISFNLYSPHIYGNEDLLDDLKKEFLPLFEEASFADEIIINLNGSFKYLHSHVYRAGEYLCKIMEELGFRAVREHFVRHFKAGDPEAKECQKYGEPFMMEFGGSGSSDVLKDITKKLGFNPLHEVFGGSEGNQPRGLDILPTYFARDGNIVKFRYANTMNMGRWKKVKNKGDINEVNPFRQHQKYPKLICNVFAIELPMLGSDGTLYLCSGGYWKQTGFANISESWEKIFESYQKVYEGLKSRYKKDLPKIVNDTCNNWYCGK